jgi:uncharacterized protein
MSIRSNLVEMLKKAMRDNDTPRKNVIRCLRAKAEEHLCAKNLPRDLDDDAMYTKVIGTYRKAISNALSIMDKNAAAKDSPLAESYRFEIGFCDALLPREKSEAETLPLVQAKIAELKATGPDHVGKVVGAVMKCGHEGVSAAVVKRIALELLSSPAEKE